MDPDSVPLEIWLRILEIVYESYCGNSYSESHWKDFKNYMTVCKSWYLPAKQFLYRSVHITTVLSLTKLVQYLKANNLGHHVKNVRILGYGDRPSDNSCYPQQLVNEFIRICPNVEELDMKPSDLWELFIQQDNIPNKWRYLKSVRHFPSSDTIENSFLNVYYYYRESLTNMCILQFRDRSNDFLKWRQKLCEFPAITCLMVVSPTLFASMQLLSPIIQSMRELKRLSTNLISPSAEEHDIQQYIDPLAMESISIAFTNDSFEWKNVSYVTRLFSTVDSADIPIHRCFYSWTNSQVNAMHDLLDLLPRCKIFKVKVTQDETVVDNNSITIQNTRYYDNILRHYQVDCSGIERILAFHFFIDHEAKDYSLSPSNIDSYTTLVLEGSVNDKSSNSNSNSNSTNNKNNNNTIDYNFKRKRSVSFVHNESDVPIGRWLDIIKPVFENTCSYINTLVFDFTRTVLGETVCAHTTQFNEIPTTYTILERFPMVMFQSLLKISINSYLARQFSIFENQHNSTVEQLQLAQCYLTNTFLVDSLTCFKSLQRLALICCHIEASATSLVNQRDNNNIRKNNNNNSNNNNKTIIDLRHPTLKTIDLMKPCFCQSVNDKLDYKGYFLTISIEQKPDRYYLVSRDFYIVEETSADAFHRYRQMQSKNQTPTIVSLLFSSTIERINVFNDYRNFPETPLRSFEF